MKLQIKNILLNQCVGAIAMGHLIGPGIEAFLHRLANTTPISFSTLVQIGGRSSRKLPFRIHSRGAEILRQQSLPGIEGHISYSLINSLWPLLIHVTPLAPLPWSTA